MSKGRMALCCLWLTLLALISLAAFPRPVLADGGTVGTGSAASCTEAAFDTVFFATQSSGGGTITFNCGAEPHTILFATVKSVSEDTTLRGGDLITLSGSNTTSIFQVYAGKHLTLSHLTLTRGYGAFGAVQNFGRLDVDGSEIVNSSATGSGGAVSNYGDVTLTNVVMAGNSAVELGGGIYTDGGSVTVTNSRFSNNLAGQGGGGIAATNAASLTVGGSNFSGNRATGTFAEGGAVRSAGTLTITESVFLQNSASRGGALHVESGSADVTHTTIGSNWASYGGGIRHVGGDLSLADVTFARNGYAGNGTRVTTGGGAISWDGGRATLTNVTMEGNWASYGGGFDHENGTTTLTNVTMSGNAAVGSGAFDQGGGSIALTNVTIADNEAPFFGGGIGNRGGTLTLTNTLLSGNLNSDNNRGSNCYKPATASTFSLSGDFTCGFGAGRDNVNLRLGPLADNGGFTRTHLLRKGSPAIDTGSGTGCPATDQRAVPRPQGEACDIGAVEVTAADLVIRIFLPFIGRNR